MCLLIGLFLPKNLETQIRQRAANQTYENGHCHRQHPPSLASGAACEHEQEQEHEGGRWTSVAHAFVMDWSMLWKEILGGLFDCRVFGDAGAA